MLTFIVRRLIAAVGLLLVVALITYCIFYELPQWAGMTVDNLASEFVGKSQNQDALNGVIDRFHFNQPFFVQYYDYVKAILVGDTYSDGTQLIHCNAPCFGYSFRNSEQVWPTLLDRFPVTFSLAIGAAVLWLIFGLAIGVISAVRKGSILDRSVMIVALLGVALPVYFVGPLIWMLDGFPAVSYSSFLSNPLSWAQALWIPWVALAFGYAAIYARMTRAGMLDALGEDFVRTARAKGLSNTRVILRHGLRAAIMPIVTMFGMDVGALLGGAVLVESVFSLPGIGYLAINSLGQSDLPMIMGVTLMAAFFVIIANLVVDVLYASLDPRVRMS
ncbi:ABC transporter permease [Actinospica durhamensis]|uniref:ABC transporter permease n=1 Tax=Actinospica durhamensis TaxID=1508375 RepID=A0A941INF0_9ACTN|nr:ABC transporter permease [Actinospica durhamensis]MBR7835335.1 ABC transporter permease [Actinospica durhamensis]